MAARLPAHLEASAILRLAESQGGFATVLGKGDRDAGTILLVTMCRGAQAQLLERMPMRDGSRSFVATKSQDAENPHEFSDYLERRRRQDPDIWIIEADVADVARFIASLPD